MNLTHLKLAAALSAAALLGMAGAAQAEYPKQSISYIIPFNPGGESDVTARFQEPILEELLGVSVNVSHRPGGGGAVAWSEFQQNARPDGYTLIGVNIPHIIAQPIQRSNAGYNTEDWEIITFFHSTPTAVIVPASSPFNTLEDLIAYAKENPQAVTMGGSGTFSSNHLDTLRFEEAAGIDLTYIPFTGTGPLPAALEGRHVTGVVNATMLGVQMGERVKVLAVASAERVAALPDVPTFRELGYDIVGGAYRGVAAPKGTPEAIIAKLADAFGKANERLAERQQPMGFVMEYITGDAVSDIMATLKSAYGPILESAN